MFKVGEAHEKTKESSEYLKYLTQQAVALQRTMNEIYKNGSNASIMPLKVSHTSTVPGLIPLKFCYMMLPGCFVAVLFSFSLFVSVVYGTKHGQCSGTA